MIIEHDAITGQTVEREATTEELTQAELDAQAFVALQAEKEIKVNAKISAIAKLAALGLTEDEAKAIIG